MSEASFSSGLNEYSRDAIGSGVWREILAVANEYELHWLGKSKCDPKTFASKYPKLPQDLLISELQRLDQELSAEITNGSKEPSENSRFTILDLIRTGGMGMIYRGIDHDCNRQVAIKKIRPEFRQDHEAQRRFHHEADLTAELEHPGIIPIYGKGIDDQGQHFYAMRLISPNGASTLSAAIEAFHKQLSRITPTKRELSLQCMEQLRQLTRNLINVTETIAYTHSRGIVHRDLKPANILLGPYGETLIADWGLAKRIDSAGATQATQSSDWPEPSNSESDQQTNPRIDATAGVGTRGYTAPELVQGYNAASLRAADIYSLGATLHCILHGTPHPLNTTAEHDAVNLVSIIPTVKYLQAIADKAMATDWSNRYARAEDFREDLLNWIAGEAVSAKPEGWWESAMRWPTRHRTAATGLASALAIALISGSLFLWVQSRQKRALDAQASQLKLALDDSARLLIETSDAKALAEQANIEAQEDRRVAVENKELAQKRESLAFEGLLRFQDILLSNQAAFQSDRLSVVQEQLLQQTKATFAGILENLSENSSPHPQTPRYLTVLTHRLAAMERQSGREEQSLEVIDQACDWMQRCLNSDALTETTKTGLQRSIGELRSLQGNIALLARQVERAKPAVNESISRLSPLVQSNTLNHSEHQEALAALAQSYSASSTIRLFEGDVDAAIDSQSKALDLLVNQDPTNHSSAMVAAQAHFGMAILHENANQLDQAIRQCELASKALVRAERFSDGNPPLEFLAYRSQLAHHHSNLLLKQGDHAAAIQVMTRQIDHDAHSLQSKPGIGMLLDSYQKTATTLQGLYTLSGRIPDAVALCQTWSNLAEPLLRDNPQSEQAFHFAILANHIGGHLDEQIRRPESALEKYRKAIEICDQADRKQIQSARTIYQKVELEMHLLQFHYQSELPQDAEPIFQRAVLAAEKLLNGFPQSDSQELSMASKQLQRGIETMRKAMDFDLAEKWVRKLRSSDLWDRQ